MEQFRCEECQRGFVYQESLNQHNRVKHRSLPSQNGLKQIKKQEKVRLIKKPIFKYAVVSIIILIPLVLLIHHFSSKNYSVGSTGSSVQNSLNEMPPAGSKALDFSLPSSTGNKISLSDYKGKKNVLLYFMEGVMCDPCWQQTLDIEKEYGKFQSRDIELITITVDPLNAVTKNARRFGITLPILADEDLKVSSSYDVLKDAMHPGERPGHTFILVDKEGNIIWRKAYFLASGSTIMTMDMGGRKMTMDMGMDMGTPDSVMYLPVDKLLSDLEDVKLDAAGGSSPSLDMAGMSAQDMSAQDHSMCLTPIHNHVDFKMYLGENLLNFSQNNYMDQSNIVHFHKTVKVKPDDISGIPNGLLIHLHKENIMIGNFLKTLDLPFNVDGIQRIKVYANGADQSAGLNYVIQDKNRLLVTDSNDESQIKSQMGSVTDYALQGKEKNPSLFGGC